MRFRLALTIVLLTVLMPASALAQTIECPEFEGVTCDGAVTDTVGVVEDDAALEEAIGRLVATYGQVLLTS